MLLKWWLVSLLCHVCSFSIGGTNYWWWSIFKNRCFLDSFLIWFLDVSRLDGGWFMLLLLCAPNIIGFAAVISSSSAGSSKAALSVRLLLLLLSLCSYTLFISSELASCQRYSDGCCRQMWRESPHCTDNYLLSNLGTNFYENWQQTHFVSFHLQGKSCGLSTDQTSVDQGKKQVLLRKKQHKKITRNWVLFLVHILISKGLKQKNKASQYNLNKL